MVGDAEGRFVGLFEGCCVGLFDGTRVGDALGRALGDVVGLLDGARVGDFEGLCVGDLLGRAVGTGVGNADGDGVGLVDGRPVGLLLGAAVGTGVGNGDGDAVGPMVTTGSGISPSKLIFFRAFSAVASSPLWAESASLVFTRSTASSSSVNPAPPLAFFVSTSNVAVPWPASIWPWSVEKSTSLTSSFLKPRPSTSATAEAKRAG